MPAMSWGRPHESHQRRWANLAGFRNRYVVHPATAARSRWLLVALLLTQAPHLYAAAVERCEDADSVALDFNGSASELMRELVKVKELDVEGIELMAASPI